MQACDEFVIAALMSTAAKVCAHNVCQLLPTNRTHGTHTYIA